MDTDFDLDEIARERDGTDFAAAARESFFAAGQSPVRWRDVQVVASAQPAPVHGGRGTGRSLVSRRPAPRQKRYERIIGEERVPAHRIDYKLQICCASAVLEEEVNDLLAEPLRSSAPLLASAVRAGGDKNAERTAGYLDRWGAGTEPTTLGLVTMGVLVAVRRGLARDEATFAPLLDRLFSPDLVAAIRANALGPALDQLRMMRNNSCHPGHEFDEPAYRQFVIRLVGTSRLMDWENAGPVPDPPPPDAGFLHRLLTGSRLLPTVDLPPAGSPLDRLTALAAPRDGAFGLELVPYVPTAGQRFRDVSVEAVRAEPRFRLGGELVLRVRADRNCHLVLVDLGTTGAVSLLLPNVFCPRPVLAGGETAYFPGPVFADFALRLQGAPGRERLVAVATVDPLPGLPAPGAGAAFATLADADLASITATVRGLPGERWAAAACEFTIEG